MVCNPLSSYCRNLRNLWRPCLLSIFIKTILRFAISRSKGTRHDRPFKRYESHWCRSIRWADVLVAACNEFTIVNPTAQRMFLAQIAHESGRFKFMREIWGLRPPRMATKAAKTLGITMLATAFKYRARPDPDHWPQELRNLRNSAQAGPDQPP